LIRHLGHRAVRRLRWSAAVLRACLRGWRCRSRILVIESDDWGSIRTASREARDRLADMGYAMHRSKYNLDALETDADMEALLEVLGGVRDHRGRPACMTANVIMANPDFERIRESNFEEYFFEPVDATLARSDARRGVAAKWAEGARRGLFVPQLHGREHLRWWKWMEALRGGSQEARAAFDLEMCGVPYAASKEGLPFYASPYVSDEELERHGVDLEAMVCEGSELFEQQFGYASAGAIAPCYCWTPHVERIWSLLGIRYIQGILFQDVGGTGRKSHYLGERGVAGAWYLVRNCHFEPAQEELLATVKARWPDVCFLSSRQVGAMIERGLASVTDLDAGAPGLEEG